MSGEPFFRIVAKEPVQIPAVTSVMLNISVRLMMLLNHLTDRSFKEPPRNVGLRTVINARDEGLLLVIDDDFKRRRPRCKLTPAGKAYREKHGIRF